MNKLSPTDWVAILAAFGMILSVIVSISTLLGRKQSKVAENAELKSDVKHIRENVDNTSRMISAL